MTCNEILFDEPWHAAAVCTEPFGEEHSHSDLTVPEAIAAGVARPVSDDDVLVALP